MSLVNSHLRRNLKRTIRKFDECMLGWIVKLVYPKYKRRAEYKLNYAILTRYAVAQKIIGINRRVPWPVHFTSVVLAPEKIIKGRDCDPGDNLNNYIQAFNGIEFGDFVELGPGVKIISANHSDEDMLKPKEGPAVRIGSNVWLGADVIVLPGVSIGDNVTVGAGSVVTSNLPSNCVAVGNPCRVLRSKAS